MSLSEVAVLEVLSSGMVSILLGDALESLLDRLNLPCILTSDISRTSFFFSLFPEPHKPATSPPLGAGCLAPGFERIAVALVGVQSCFK
jgi:hypothetical protein